MSKRLMPFVLCAFATACSCGDRDRSPEPLPVVDLHDQALVNQTPHIPAQCYTKTLDGGDRAHNPCFVCHQHPLEPNYTDDADLQLSYAFPRGALRNPWTNLFVDRRAAIERISDDEILDYVRRSNYLADDGSILLASKLSQVPAAWDVDGDGRWGGWIPDIHFSFDERGFDRMPGGGHTGWRAYAYHPFPGTFWPTNGSFGDALIRLPAAFREDETGRLDLSIYETNLAIVEAAITRRDVAIPATDERALGVDLDGDGALGEASIVKFRRNTPGGHRMSFVGRARTLLAQGELHLEAGLFPEGTELAHSVRYLDVDGAGRPVIAARMKELRYMVKRGWLTTGDLESNAWLEARDKRRNPHKLRRVGGNAESGIGNRAGWRMQAFIEDASGDLRPQSREEHAFCVGCHSGVGATTDSVFSFARKLPAQGGWFHWTKRGLAGVGERVRADGQGEYAHYLEENGAGDEFRANEELIARFFGADRKLRPEIREALRHDVGELLLPSKARALALNKAYRLIVREQSFVRGRDATIAPVGNVHRELRLDEDEEAEPTGVESAVPGPYLKPVARTAK